MLFNSLDFAIFLPIVFFLYWFVSNKNLAFQNCIIVFSSYLFYGWWDWRFLSLIAFSTLVDFSIGNLLGKIDNNSKRKLLLWLSIFVNLGLLGFFKYYNFFIENFVSAFSFLGYDLNFRGLNIVLPVGISFYTFQTMSYTIDVYRKKLAPTKDFIAFSAFVSFFPQLVAGPIERATNLLPQFYKKRIFDYTKAIDGCRQILWGLFKKVVIADTCAIYSDQIFDHSLNYSGIILFLGAIFFSFQIYCDFSGYSDIAIGVSRFFGFELMQNFSFPYFSRDIAEFWRRWHISLSTWFRDYLYIPLGGSKGNLSQKVRNTFVIFLVSGFWHGANWTFLFWGGINALYFLPLLLANNNRKHLGKVAEGRVIPSSKEFISILLTFFICMIAWVFFRAESLSHAFSYIIHMFQSPGSFFLFDIYLKYSLVISLLCLFLIIEWLGRHHAYAIEKTPLQLNKPIRYIFYYSLIFAVFWFGGKEQQFIYFQF